MSSKLRFLSFTCLSFAISAHAMAALQALQVNKIQSECGVLYKVVAGDGCWAIANNAHITQKQLEALNPGLNCGTLAPGDGLCLQLPCSKRYEVKNGEWCAKIQDEQKVSQAEMESLNPGLVCEELFPGQHICLAAPEELPPTDDNTPPTLPPTTEEPDAIVRCDFNLPIAVGDTCESIATYYGIQLSQLTAMNAKLDCKALHPGEALCVKPACSEVYNVQKDDTCAKVEGEFSLKKDQLASLNPGLSCDKFVPGQVLCVAEPPAEEEVPYTPGLLYRDQYPMLSPGSTVPQSQVLSFVNSPQPRDSFFGDVVFQHDSQHKATFTRLDANGDGKLGLDELTEIFAANPRISRGVHEIDDKMTHDNFAKRVMETADLNKDGFIDVDEYLSAIFVTQNATNYATELALQGENGLSQERAIPLLVIGLAGLAALFVGLSFADMMRELERKSRVKAGDMLKYLEITHWDRGQEPEPKCAAYTYYSTSCAALGHHWSSHCSEGGEKVFDSSCRKPFADGAKGCGFLGCSSLCYKVNTDGCDCDALKYSAEEGVAYDDPPLSTTDESGVGSCRKKCRGQNNCIGFSVSPGKKSRPLCLIHAQPVVPRSS
ncbi:hypothetical protein ONZ45_g15349 [Pleurotus djamor]|nr:hypothetical protein ONZ45_g15349 [Pleurotus djamor]